MCCFVFSGIREFAKLWLLGPFPIVLFFVLLFYRIYRKWKWQWNCARDLCRLLEFFPYCFISFLSQDIASSRTQHEMQALHLGHWPSHNPLLGLCLHCASICRASSADFCLILGVLFCLFWVFFWLHPNLPPCTNLQPLWLQWSGVKSCWCKISAIISFIQFC